MKAPATGIALRAWWDARDARERRLLQLAFALVVVGLVYGLAIAPAWKIWRSHQDTAPRLQAAWQTMVQLQAQAKTLQAQPRQNAAAARAALQSAVQAMGAQADVTFGPEGARVVLRNVDGQTLAQWLASARIQAGSVPLQANISRNGAAWSGTVVMTVPTP